jgi:pyrroloquinoline quinone (PQQ) biosynthesis protein C
MAYVWSLARSYLTTHATPPTMIAVAERFAQAGKSDLAERCHTMAREESGHDTLVLRDLAALGYSAEPLVAAIHPQIGVALVDLFQRYAKSDHPIGCFGYAYALERQALFCDASVIAAVENVIPAGIHATRCLRVHSAVGADLNHVYESLEFMATMSATEQVRIASAVFETTSVMNDPALLDFPGDEVVAARIAAFSTELPSISAA